MCPKRQKPQELFRCMHPVSNLSVKWMGATWEHCTEASQCTYVFLEINKKWPGFLSTRLLWDFNFGELSQATMLQWPAANLLGSAELCGTERTRDKEHISWGKPSNCIPPLLEYKLLHKRCEIGVDPWIKCLNLLSSLWPRSSHRLTKLPALPNLRGSVNEFHCATWQ